MVHTQGYLVWLLVAVTSGATACISHSMVAQLQDVASIERASPKTQVEATSDAAAFLPFQGQSHSPCERPTQGHEYYGSWGARLGDQLYHN